MKAELGAGGETKRARRRDGIVIVRLMGEGQYRVDDELAARARTSSTTRRWRRSSETTSRSSTAASTRCGASSERGARALPDDEI